MNFGRIANRIVGSDSPCLSNESQHQSGPEAAGFEIATLGLVASRPWFDLVCSEDFLHPFQELFLTIPNRQHTEHFRKGPERRLPLGDYIMRMTLARVEYWKNLLDRAFNQIFFIDQRELPFQARDELLSAKLDLDEACKGLVRACHQTDNKLREAATTLVQIHVAYAPHPRLEWMQMPPGWLEAQRGPIRSCIRRRGTLITAEQRGGQLFELERQNALLCDPMVLRQIAAALEDLTPLYGLPPGNRQRLKWAFDRARLVMVDSRPRAAYWDGKPIAEDEWCSNEREWDLLWTLARHAGGIVNQGMLANPDGQAIRSRRHRLSKLLSESTLDQLIETRRGEGYLLTLDADLVILLRNVDGQLAVA